MKMYLAAAALLVSTLGLPSAKADICQALDTQIVDVIRTKIIGLSVSEEGDPRMVRKGRIVQMGYRGTPFQLDGRTFTDVSLNLDSGATIIDADLGHLFLDCGSRGLTNLAGALKASGILCAPGQFASNIPDSILDANCNAVK